MKQQAEGLGITGWVINRADGCVETVIQGSEAAVAAMLVWAQSGPPLAKIMRVEQSTAAGEFTDFQKRPSA